MIRTYIFSGTAVLYFIGCIFGVTAVSDSIANYIGEHGWSHYNVVTAIVGGVLAILFLGLLGYRLWMKLPSWLELLFGLAGLAGTVYVLTQFVLLTTEYVHIPQFLLFTLILCLAFPNHLLNAVIFSSIGCIADEWVQAWMPGRRLDLNDVFLNFIGMYFGLVVWWCISGLTRSNHSTDSNPTSDTPEMGLE